nr:CHAT domain-containing tetratricopeptide repeat protein [uncultured Allomuricauda sp.]
MRVVFFSLFVLVSQITLSQSFSEASTNVRKARSLSNNEKFDKAIALLETVKTDVSNAKNFKDFKIFKDYCRAVILESEIYEELGQYDKSIEVIEPVRLKIKQEYDINYVEVFNMYTMVVIQASQAHLAAKRYDEALNGIRHFRMEVKKKYSLKDDEVFSNYEMLASNEGIIYMEKDGFLRFSEFEDQIASEIKSIMHGNDNLIDFYFSNKKSSILHSVQRADKTPTMYTSAVSRTRRLLDELYKYTAYNDKKRKRLIESVTDDFFWYKSASLNPFMTGNQNPSLSALKEAKSKLEELLTELEANKYISDEDKIDRQEKIKKDIVSTTDQIKQKELQEGKYQDYISYQESKSQIEKTKKDYAYFIEEWSRISSLAATEMYFQQVKLLNNLLEEIENSGLKNENIGDYGMLNYFIYNSLYASHIVLNNSNEALVALKKAHHFYKNLPDDKRNDETLSTFDLLYSTYYSYTKQYDKALEYSFKYLNAEVDNPEKMYGTLGMIYYEMREYTKAIEWYKKGISVLKEKSTLPIDALMNALTYYNLGRAYLAGNDFDKAEKYLTLAKNGLASTNIESVDFIATGIQSDLAIIYLEKNDIEKADQNMMVFCESFRIPYFKSLLGSTENDRASISSQNEYSPNTIFYYLSQRNVSSDKLISYGYDYALLSKQLLLNTAETIRKNASINEIPELKVINTKWKATIAKLKEVDVENKDSLMDYAKVYEKELIGRGKRSIMQLFENSRLEWTDIKSSLQEAEAAVEFVTFSPYKFDDNYDEVRYGAFVLTKDSEFPIFINLFNEDELDEIIASVMSKNNSVKNQVSKLYEENGETLYRLIWQPLENSLNGMNRIYFSPSGILHNFSFSALRPTDGNKESLGSKYDLIRLSSTKHIVESKKISGFKKALLFGDIAYNYDEKKFKVTGQRKEESTNRGSDFDLLPGTKEEIDEIEKILIQRGIELSKFTGSSASEESLLKAVRTNPDILHIGTHAFYLKPVKEEFFMTDMVGFARLKGERNPMNRSGLVFSNANYFWKFGDKISENSKDGILTANEISTLDLSNIELAVLSACETALGESSTNEGVFGLQRGLKMAEVKNLLLSLWKVDDLVTKEYMVDFYNNLINEGQNINTAYSNTQEFIKSKYPNPYFWAAFVLIE